MSKTLKVIFFAVSGFIGLLVIIVLALLFFVDANAYKSRLEVVASQAMGMEVSIGGRLSVGLFPGFLITLKDVHIRNRGTDVASAKEARLGIDLLPLLKNEVRIGKLALKHPRISIERNRDGKFNFEFEKPDTAGETLPALGLARISLSDGTLHYADKQSGEGFEAGNCSLEVRRLRLSGGESPDFMKNLSFTAEVACGSIRKNDIAVSGLKFSAHGADGIFDLKPVAMYVFGAQGSGNIQANFLGVVPRYHVRYSLPQFRIEEVFKTLASNKAAEGPMDLSVNLSMQGKTVHQLMQTADGEISLQGENLTLHGNDIDRKISRFESSQNINLLDVGAFFLAGPVGLTVTKGYDFVNIFRGSGGRSAIRKLVSGWKVNRGMAQAQDVAMATNQNRIALQGELDFVNDRFNDVTIAVIDARGCATVRQKIRGTFQKPVVERPSILKSLTGPAFRLFKKGRDLLPSRACEVIYAGSVAPPK